MNKKAFRSLFCNPQKSFHTFPGSSDSKNRACQSFFKLKNSISKKKKKIRLAVNFFVNAIVEFEEWLTAFILFELEDPGKVWKLFCGFQNKLWKAFFFNEATHNRNELTQCATAQSKK